MTSPASTDVVLNWVRASRIPLAGFAPGPPWDDLARLGDMIGDVTIVALGEWEHLAAESLWFRNRVFQYLVEEKGFTAVALESGIVEGRLVHDYVRGGAGDLAAVLSEGISWGFDRLPQNAALVRWLRAHNADPQRSRKVNFYGFDVPGSPGNTFVRRGLDTALFDVLRYLERADAIVATAFRGRVARLLPSLRFDRNRPHRAGYGLLSAIERAELTTSIREMLTFLESQADRFVRERGADDHQWAVQAAIGACQVDGWLREAVRERRPSDALCEFTDTTGDLRSRAQAQNLAWIAEREGPSGKLLVHAHNVHLSKTSVEWNCQPVQRESRSPRAATSYSHDAVGRHLRRRFRDRLFAIGNLIGRGDVGCAGFNRTLVPARPNSSDALAQHGDTPLFLLDLRSAPSQVCKWLGKKRETGRGFETAQGQGISFELPLGRAFDAVFCIDIVRPADSVPRFGSDAS